MAAEILSDLSRATDSNSSPLSGAKWYFYATGGLTPQSVYTTAALSVEHANPVVADSAGMFAPIYFDSSLSYRGILKDAAGNTIRDIDPINAGTARLLAQDDGSALVGFSILSANGRARNLLDKLRETPSVFDYEGIHADGTLDDFQAMQNAIDDCGANGQTLLVPSANYMISDALVVSDQGFRIRGEGLGSRIETTTASPALVIAARYGKVSGLQLQGGGVGERGIIMYDAAETVIDQCFAGAFTLDGLLFDPSYDTPTGNNNTARIVGGQYASNGRAGIWMQLALDNNNVLIERVNCSSNASHGLMIKSEGCYVDGGLFEGNAGYGIQISESGDASASVNSRILFPWIENNTLGGIRGGGMSERNIIYRKNLAQSYSAAVGSTDVEFTQATGSTVWSSGAQTYAIDLAADGAGIAARTPSGSGDSNLYVSAQGAGHILPQHDIDMLTGKVFRVNGTQVVGPQGAAVADATDAATVITQLNTLLARLRAHGLIA